MMSQKMHVVLLFSLAAIAFSAPIAPHADDVVPEVVFPMDEVPPPTEDIFRQDDKPDEKMKPKEENKINAMLDECGCDSKCRKESDMKKSKCKACSACILPKIEAKQDKAAAAKKAAAVIKAAFVQKDDHPFLPKIKAAEAKQDKAAAAKEAAALIQHPGIIIQGCGHVCRMRKMKKFCAFLCKGIKQLKKDCTMVGTKKRLHVTGRRYYNVPVFASTSPKNCGTCFNCHMSRTSRRI